MSNPNKIVGTQENSAYGSSISNEQWNNMADTQDSAETANESPTTKQANVIYDKRRFIDLFLKDLDAYSSTPSALEEVQKMANDKKKVADNQDKNPSTKTTDTPPRAENSTVPPSSVNVEDLKIDEGNYLDIENPDAGQSKPEETSSDNVSNDAPEVPTAPEAPTSPEVTPNETSKDSPEETPATLETAEPVDNYSTNYSETADKIDRINKNIDKDIKRINEKISQLEEEKKAFQLEYDELEKSLEKPDEELKNAEAGLDSTWRTFHSAIRQALNSLGKELHKKPEQRDFRTAFVDIQKAFDICDQNRKTYDANTTKNKEDRERRAKLEKQLSEKESTIASYRQEVEKQQNIKKQNNTQKEVFLYKHEEEKKKQQFEKERSDAEKLLGEPGIEGFREKNDNEIKKIEADREKELAEYDEYVRLKNARAREMELAQKFGDEKTVEALGKLTPVSEEEQKKRKEEINAKFDAQKESRKAEREKYEKLFAPDSRANKIKSLFSKLNFVAAINDYREKRMLNRSIQYYSNISDHSFWNNWGEYASDGESFEEDASPASESAANS